MKLIRFLFVSVFTISLTVALNIRIQGIPPLGKFLDPFNGFWQNAEQDGLMAPNVTIEGLSGPVTIYYDEYYIPHITAENEEDLYFAQGYVTAQHRLWQMEFQTLVAAGRLSEILGSDLLEFDRLQRRKGLAYGAKNAVKAMEDDTSTYRIVQSYAQGANAYISSLSWSELPLEYKLLNYKPELWSPYKTALLLKFMADKLSSSEADLENTNALKLFGKETFDRFFPRRNPGDVPIIPKGKDWNFEGLQIESKDLDYFEEYIHNTIIKQDPDNGSNNWVVGSSKTLNGYPMLANDMHLELNLPSVWFLAQLSTPDINVIGATLPGAPAVIVGCNDSIAWGVTNAKRDVVDWYHIEYKDLNKDEYKYGNQWLKTQKLVEQYDIRNEESFYDTVVYTHYGPVMYDENFGSEFATQNFAMKWTAHDESNEQKTFYLLNKAQNYNEFEEALSFFDCPAQNFVFASVANDIAVKVQGKFPLKWEEQGVFLMDGSNPQHVWQDIIPNAHNPYILNPEEDFLFSANQYPVDSTYPYNVYDYHYEDFRNRRINQRLQEMQQITANDLMLLQNDNFNQKASMVLPFMLNNLDSLSLTDVELEYFTLLTTWNYFNDVEQEAPSAFLVWWDQLYNSLWDEFESDTIALIKPESFNTLDYLISAEENDVFFDILSTPAEETKSELISNSFSSAVDSLENWKSDNPNNFIWGDFKKTSVMHLLRLKPFSVENARIGGYRNIINANSRRHGVSIRMIVEMSDQKKLYFIYPGGQSGNPGNPYYDNFIQRWADGNYIEPVFFDGSQEDENILFTQKLNP